MAGSMRLLDSRGIIIRGPIAMNLLTDVSGVDYVGGNIFYATDTHRVSKLHYQDGVLQLVSRVNVVNLISGAQALHAITSNGSGHWVIVSVLEDAGGGGFALLYKIYRLDLDSNVLYALPGLSLPDVGIITFDLTNDGRHLWALWHIQGVGFTQTTRKCYYDNAVAIQETTTTAKTVRYASFCFNGKDFYVIKGNNFKLAITNWAHKQIHAFLGPSVRSEAMCLIRGMGPDSGLEAFEDNDVGYDYHGIGSGTAIVAHVT